MHRCSGTLGEGQYRHVTKSIDGTFWPAGNLCPCSTKGLIPDWSLDPYVGVPPHD